MSPAIVLEDLAEQSNAERFHRVGESFYSRKGYSEQDIFTSTCKQDNSVAQELQIQRDGSLVGTYRFNDEAFEVYETEDGVYALGVEILDLVPCKICNKREGLDLGLVFLQHVLSRECGIDGKISLFKRGMIDSYQA